VNLPRSQCNVPTCSGMASRRGLCSLHAGTLQQGQRADGQPKAHYRTSRWQQLSLQVRREEPWCRKCTAEGRPAVPSEETDHIIPLERGGTDDRENLQALCRKCHALKTRRETL